MIFFLSLVFISLTVPGFVLATRALPWVDEKVLEGVKPWACDICMSFWSTVLWGLIAAIFFGRDALAAAPPSYTIALALLGFMSRPSAAPPSSFPGEP